MPRDDRASRRRVAGEEAMKHEEEERLPLSALRTTPPLREADYAAIRARVQSQMAEKKRRGWFWQFAVAAALIAVVAIFMFRPEEKKPQVTPLTRPTATLSPQAGRGATNLSLSRETNICCPSPRVADR